MCIAILLLRLSVLYLGVSRVNSLAQNHSLSAPLLCALSSAVLLFYQYSVSQSTSESTAAWGIVLDHSLFSSNLITFRYTLHSWQGSIQGMRTQLTSFFSCHWALRQLFFSVKGLVALEKFPNTTYPNRLHSEPVITEAVVGRTELWMFVFG